MKWVSNFVKPHIFILFIQSILNITAANDTQGKQKTSHSSTNMTPSKSTEKTKLHDAMTSQIPQLRRSERIKKDESGSGDVQSAKKKKFA